MAEIRDIKTLLKAVADHKDITEFIMESGEEKIIIKRQGVSQCVCKNPPDKNNDHLMLQER